MAGVDLGRGDMGMFERRDGKRCFTWVYQHEDGTFMVRWEHGWHESFTREGRYLGSMVKGGMLDIVSFEPCPYPDPWPDGLRSGFQ